MKTVRASMRLGNLSPAQKVNEWGNVKSKMTNNPHFTNISPSLNLVDNEVQILNNAISAAQSGDHSKVSAMHAQEARVNNFLSQLINYVENTANAAALNGADAADIVSSAGMYAVSSHHPAPVPQAPAGVQGSSTAEGQINLNWESVPYARVYIIKISNDVSVTGNTSTTGSTGARVYTTWTIIDVCTKPRITLSNLSSGTKYALSIVSLGTAGKSGDSSTVVVKVL